MFYLAFEDFTLPQCNKPMAGLCVCCFRLADSGPCFRYFSRASCVCLDSAAWRRIYAEQPDYCVAFSFVRLQVMGEVRRSPAKWTKDILATRPELDSFTD